MSYNTEAFLKLIRLGIGHDINYGMPKGLDWEEIEVLAGQHGLSAILVDGIERLPEGNRPPQDILLQWIGDSIQNYEYRYEQYKRAISNLASFYKSHGFKMMVLKGYVCAVNWPKPEHRPCGDIDIWLFGKQKDADAALEARFNNSKVSKTQEFKIDSSHHHHTVFEWQGFTVENHYDFINVNRHKSHTGLEQLFKELGADDSNYLDLNGIEVYLPPPNLHALFLLRHALNHFASIGINLRQVLDWAFFIEKHTKEIDWNWLVGLLEKYHMKDFYCCLNAICVEDLGFSSNIFPSVQFDPRLKDKVLNDILNPAFATKEPQGLIKRVAYKYRRWKGDAWKHELCFNESRWSAFCTGVWAKILKPASFLA